jgi:hypothetical protein
LLNRATTWQVSDISTALSLFGLKQITNQWEMISDRPNVVVQNSQLMLCQTKSVFGSCVHMFISFFYNHKHLVWYACCRLRLYRAFVKYRNQCWKSKSGLKFLRLLATLHNADRPCFIRWHGLLYLVSTISTKSKCYCRGIINKSRPGLTNSSIFFSEIWWNRTGLNSKIGEFWNSNSIFLKKSKNT